MATVGVGPIEFYASNSMVMSKLSRRLARKQRDGICPAKRFEQGKRSLPKE